MIACLIRMVPRLSFRHYRASQLEILRIVYPHRFPRAKTLALVGQDGTVLDDTRIVTLGPGQQIAKYLWQDLVPMKFRGSLVLRGQNGQTFFAIGLLEKQGLYTIIPLSPGKAPGVPD